MHSFDKSFLREQTAKRLFDAFAVIDQFVHFRAEAFPSSKCVRSVRDGRLSDVGMRFSPPLGSTTKLSSAGSYGCFDGWLHGRCSFTYRLMAKIIAKHGLNFESVLEILSKNYQVLKLSKSDSMVCER